MNTKTHLLLAIVSLAFFVPAGVAGEDDNWRIKKSVWTSVVQLDQVASSNQVVGTGTGFIVSKVVSRPRGTNRVYYLATNKHMLGDWNLADGDISNYYKKLLVHCYSPETKPRSITLTDDAGRLRNEVVLHPDPSIDIAIIPLTGHTLSGGRAAGFSNFDVSFLCNYTNTTEVGLGNSVFALGYPFGITSVNNNYPIAKRGEIASIPGVEFSISLPVENRAGQPRNVNLVGKVYLVDGLLVKGNSGGPIVLPVERKLQIEGEGFRTTGNQNLVIGMMSMLLNGAGLSVVYSSDYVVELINSFEKRILDLEGETVQIRL